MSSRNSSISCAASSARSMPSRLGPFQQRVVDVGDVLHVVHLVARVQPAPVHQVERQIGGRVPEVGGVVRGDPADVQGRGRAGLVGRTVAGRGVVEPQNRAGPGQHRDVGRGPGPHAGHPTGHGPVRPPRRVRCTVCRLVCSTTACQRARPVPRRCVRRRRRREHQIAPVPVVRQVQRVPELVHQHGFVVGLRPGGVEQRGLADHPVRGHAQRAAGGVAGDAAGRPPPSPGPPSAAGGGR